MAHECKEFEVDGRAMWLHLQTDTSNVLLEKTARALAWTGPSADEEEATSPREAVPGSRLRVELHHHNKVDVAEGDGVDTREVQAKGFPIFHAVATAQLVLPNGEVVDVEARA